MTVEEAYVMLGVEASASVAECEAAYQVQKNQLEAQIRSAESDAQRAKYADAVERLDQAWRFVQQAKGTYTGAVLPDDLLAQRAAGAPPPPVEPKAPPSKLPLIIGGAVVALAVVVGGVVWFMGQQETAKLVAQQQAAVARINALPSDAEPEELEQLEQQIMGDVGGLPPTYRTVVDAALQAKRQQLQSSISAALADAFQRVRELETALNDLNKALEAERTRLNELRAAEESLPGDDAVGRTWAAMRRKFYEDYLAAAATILPSDTLRDLVQRGRALYRRRDSAAAEAFLREELPPYATVTERWAEARQQLFHLALAEWSIAQALNGQAGPLGLTRRTDGDLLLRLAVEARDALSYLDQGEPSRPETRGQIDRLRVLTAADDPAVLNAEGALVVERWFNPPAREARSNALLAARQMEANQNEAALATLSRLGEGGFTPTTAFLQTVSETGLRLAEAALARRDEAGGLRFLQQALAGLAGAPEALGQFRPQALAVIEGYAQARTTADWQVADIIAFFDRTVSFYGGAEAEEGRAYKERTFDLVLSRADAFYAANQWDRALDAYTRYQELSGRTDQSRATRLRLADIAMRKGDMARASAEFRAIATLPDLTPAELSQVRRTNVSLAEAMARGGDLAGAKAELNRLLAATDMTTEDRAFVRQGFARIADILATAGNLNGALAELRSVSGLPNVLPAEADSYRQQMVRYAIRSLEANNLAQAAALMNEIMALPGLSTTTRGALGEGFFRLFEQTVASNPTTALQYLRTSVSLVPVSTQDVTRQRGAETVANQARALVAAATSGDGLYEVYADVLEALGQTGAASERAGGAILDAWYDRGVELTASNQPEAQRRLGKSLLEIFAAVLEPVNQGDPRIAQARERLKEPEDPNFYWPISQLQRQPTAIRVVNPVYPAGTPAGRVTLEVFIERDGRVNDVRVVDSTSAELDAPAIAAVRQWAFTPGIRNGQPVRCRPRLPIAVTGN